MADPDDWTPELTIARQKIEGYLLNLDHRKGRHKARWFIARGFRPDYDPPLLAALFHHARPSQLVREFDTDYGRRFVYEGPLTCEDGTCPFVRSVWQSSGGDNRRFFVTAYPV